MNLNSAEAMRTDIVNCLLGLALRHGHQAFCDAAFRWREIEERKSNRLFNELVVTAIGFVVLRLDDELVPASKVPDIASIREQLPPRYQAQLTAMGLASSLVINSGSSS